MSTSNDRKKLNGVKKKKKKKKERKQQIRERGREKLRPNLIYYNIFLFLGTFNKEGIKKKMI
jgi:Mg2+/citrate symporter